MKNSLLGLLLLFFCTNSFSQNGLKRIFVEKYYVSDKKDYKASKGKLPVGSVTYRIFVEMEKAYRFQAAYGSQGHELKIVTTTSFYNNVEFGATVSNEIPSEHLKDNTVMLDSWISVGAAAKTFSGIPKESDDESANIANSNVSKALQNDDPLAGIPLKVRDGLKPGSPQPVVALFGIDSLVTVFGDQKVKSKGSTFSTRNGSWASFGGSVGADPENNYVLIAQVTTDGEFSFELNMQIAVPGGGAQNYVAREPGENEIEFSGLIYPSVQNSESKASKL